MVCFPYVLLCSHRSPIHLFDTLLFFPTPSHVSLCSRLSFVHCFDLHHVHLRCVGRFFIFCSHNVSIAHIFPFVPPSESTLIPTFPVCPHISFPVIYFPLVPVKSSLPVLYVLCLIALPTPARPYFNPPLN